VGTNSFDANVVTLLFAIPAITPAPPPGGDATAGPRPTEETGLLKTGTGTAVVDDVEAKKPAQAMKKPVARGKSYGSSLLGFVLGDGNEAKVEELATQKEQQLLEQQQQEERRATATSGLWGGFLVPIYEVVCTKHNLLLITLMSILNLSCSHYIVSHASYMRLQYGAEVSASISDAFDIAFPVLGFCASIAVSPLLTAQTWLPFAVLAFAANLWLILTIVPLASFQWASVIVFGPMRTLQWASFYRIIGATPELYDAGSVGRALGYNGLVIAIFGDALSPPLLSLAQSGTTDSEESQRFMLIKFGLLAVLMPVSIALPWHLFKIRKQLGVTGTTS